MPDCPEAVCQCHSNVTRESDNEAEGLQKQTKMNFSLLLPSV